MGEQNYTSVELSRELHEAGIVGPSEFAWYEANGVWRVGSTRIVTVEISKLFGMMERFPARTASELWALLPKEIGRYRLTITGYQGRITGKVGYVYAEYNNPNEIDDSLEGACGESPHLVEALGRLLLWCKRNGHLGEVRK